MTDAERIQRTYVVLMFLETAAASLIWGVNTLFLLDAGLSLTGSFVANAAFSAGMVLFEVPTGMVADAFGRRRSYLLGAATLLISTALYLLLWRVEAGLVWWVLVSPALGLGFTFFSGATEAWLVDALKAAGYKGTLESVLARGQVAFGAAMLLGTVGGGLLGQVSLGLPYLVRSAMLLVLLGAALVWMHDRGFTPRRDVALGKRLRAIARASLEHGWGNRPVRLLALSGFFYGGATIWIFYAFQPYVLELFGDRDAIWLAGVSAAAFSSAQMVGGAVVGRVRHRFASRSGVIVGALALSAVALVAVGAAAWMPVRAGFYVAVAALLLLSLLYALMEPFRAALLNDLIPSDQRATILSFDSLAASAGGAVIQPTLGKSADVWGLGVGYLMSAGLFGLGVPFLVAARRMELDADRVPTNEPAPTPRARS